MTKLWISAQIHTSVCIVSKYILSKNLERSKKIQNIRNCLKVLIKIKDIGNFQKNRKNLENIKSMKLENHIIKLKILEKIDKKLEKVQKN